MKVLLLTFYSLAVFQGYVLAQTAPQIPVSEQRQIGGSNPSTNQNTTVNTDQGNIKPKAGIKSTVATENSVRTSTGVNNGSVIPLTTAIDRSKEYTNALKQVLNLSEDQSHKMTEVNTVLIQQIDKLSKSSRNSAEFQQGLQEADRSRVEGYNKILTTKQFKVYTETPQLSGLASAATVRADMVKPENQTEPASKSQVTPTGKNQVTPTYKNQVTPTTVK